MNEQIFELVGSIFRLRRQTAGVSGQEYPRAVTDPAVALRPATTVTSQPAAAVAPRTDPGARNRMPAR